MRGILVMVLRVLKARIPSLSKIYTFCCQTKLDLPPSNIYRNIASKGSNNTNDIIFVLIYKQPGFTGLETTLSNMGIERTFLIEGHL